MGNSLVVLANHQIKFEGRTYKEIMTEVIDKLNQKPFENRPFLEEYVADFHGDDPSSLEDIWSDWNWIFTNLYEENENLLFSESKHLNIDIEGPFSLELGIDENALSFFDPPYRQKQWFLIEDKEHINEWRKYFLHIISLLGGNRATYLGDQVPYHENVMFNYLSFKSMERALFEEYGEPKKTFKEAGDENYNSYYVDYFEDLKVI